MAMDRFLIGYTDNNSGLQTNVKPWLINDNAFASLENAYVFRGRVRKRMGSTLMGETQLNSRFRYTVDVTDGSGDFTGTVPGTEFAVGQMFSVGDVILTVKVIGTPGVLLTTNPSVTGTYNTSDGSLIITGATPATDVIFYPATPVMGLTLYYIPTTNGYISIGFDTQFSYFYDLINLVWVALTVGSSDAVWTGDDSQFFWSINYQGTDSSLNYLWTTNFNPDDGIRYFDGTTWTKASLTYNAGGDAIVTCKLMVQFQNMLLLLNTIEEVSSSNVLFYNRIRYSSSNANPLSSNAFNQDFDNGAGFITAPVQEPIVTAQFIKNRLIVYFPNSTYELVYVGNDVDPFRFQKINTELGAESTFSEIPFDKQVLGIDNTGVHACNGANVDRIDDAIPQITFSFNNVDEGPERVIGIRNYYSELAMWTFPNQDRTSSFYFPNKTLIYNYKNQSWSMNDDSVTFWGYFFQTDITPGPKWGTTYSPWEDLTILWNSGAAAQANNKFQTIIAGNQQGFVTIVQPDITSNAPSLQITNVTAHSTGMMTLSCINHNLTLGDYILLTYMNGLTFTESSIQPSPKVLPSVMAKVVTDTINADSPNSFSVIVLDNILQGVQISGTYTGGGVAARVDNINILTKQYNFYTGQDRSIYIPKIDFLVEATNYGEVSVDFLRSSSGSTIISGGPTNGVLIGSNALETFPYPLVQFEQFQSRLWHPLYFYSEGQCVQFSISMNDRQMFKYILDSNNNPTYVAQQDFQLHAMAIYATPTSSRMQ